LLGLAAVANATPTVVVGNSNVNTGVAAFSIPINVSGILSTDQVNGVVFIAEISQAGAFNATGSPSYVSIDMTTGTVFGSNQNVPAVQFSIRNTNTTVTNVAATGGPPVYTPASGPAIKTKASFLTQSGFISSNGLLATLVISTVGATPGVYDLRLITEVTGGGGGANSSFSFTGAGTTGGTSSFTNGTITVVPEPSSVVLGLFAAAGLGAVALRNRRARKTA